MDISHNLRRTTDSLVQQPDQEVDVCVSSDTRSRPGHASAILLDIRTISREITHSGPLTLVSWNYGGCNCDDHQVRLRLPSREQVARWDLS